MTLGRFTLVGCDMIQVNELLSKFQLSGFDPNAETLILTECSTTYIHADQCENLLNMLTNYLKHLRLQRVRRSQRESFVGSCESLASLFVSLSFRRQRLCSSIGARRAVHWGRSLDLSETKLARRASWTQWKTRHALQRSATSARENPVRQHSIHGPCMMMQQRVFP